MRTVLTVLVTWLVCLSFAGRLTAAPDPCKLHSIVVDDPKVHDYEGLRAYLEGMITELSRGRPLLNLQTVGAALGNAQGGSSTQTYRSAAISATLPLPPVGETSQPQPTAPTVTEPGQAAPPAPTPTAIALGANDVLSEQIELDSRVTMFRLFLDETDDDRYWPPRKGPKLRNKVVLVFRVSINDPIPNAAAEVRFTVSTADKKAPSIIQLFPEEKTYNVSRLTSNASEIKLAAVANLVGLGLGAGRKNSDVYLLRDSDTIALIEPSDNKSATFLWHFRPVLGAKMVTAGTREVYAALALPCNEEEPMTLTVEGTTRWRDFDRKTKRIGDVLAGTCSNVRGPAVEIPVPCREDRMATYRPRVIDMQIADAGSDKATVVITGDKMDQNTAVTVGDAVFREPDTLVRFGMRRLAFTVPLSRLCASSIQLVTRYGQVASLNVFPDADVPLTSAQKGLNTASTESSRILRAWVEDHPTARPVNSQVDNRVTWCKIDGVTITKADATTSSVTVRVRWQDHATLTLQPILPWAVTVGPANYAFSKLTAKTKDEKAVDESTNKLTTLTFRCDTATLRASPEIVVSRLGVAGKVRDSHPIDREKDEQPQGLPRGGQRAAGE